MGERVAIIGAGVAGLTAGYLLSRKHQVDIYEKEGRAGGNAFTYDTSSGESVDIAVAAFGKAGYPNFYKLLHELGVRTRRCLSAYMSFENLDTKQGLYMTPGLAGLFRQGFRIMGPRQVGAVWRLLRGVKRLRRMLAAGELGGLTMAQALEKVPGMRDMTRVVFLGALCLLSSQGADEVLAAPAEFFVHKLDVHNDVISPKAVWSVRAVRGYTRAYVQALAKPLGDGIHLSSEIEVVRRDADGVELIFAQGDRQRFDRLVMACHADEALSLLEKPTDDERRLLGPWRYKPGRMVLHNDHSSFPHRQLQQAYTFLYTLQNGKFNTSVNGVVRYEPGVNRRCDLISSQHPNFPISADKIEYETVLKTPIFDFDSCATIEKLSSLNGVNRTYYCGSHFGHGLHEDAVRSAVEVAGLLGVEF